MAKKSRTRRSVGGSAAIGGFNFQHALGSWAACAVLAEHAISPRWGLTSDTCLRSIRFESGQPMDDLLIETSTEGCIYMQVTTSLTRSTNPDSKLASALSQCVNQYIHGAQALATTRVMDVHRDRLVIVTDHDAPIWLRNLPDLLQRYRNDLSLVTLLDAAESSEDRQSATAIDENIDREWQIVLSERPSSEQRREILEMLRFDIFDLQSEGRDRLASLDLLRQAVLIDPSAADVTYSVITQHCAELAELHTATSRPALRSYLESQSTPLRLKGPFSFEADFKSVREVTRQTLSQLEDLSVIRPAAGPPIKIVRPSATTLAEAAQTGIGHCLVVGEPGAGKSGVVHDFVHRHVEEGTDIVYMAADRIAATTEHELKAEWELSHSLIDTLQNYPGTDAAYFVVDALDTARSEGIAALLRGLISQVIGLQSRWRVIASIRKFDLRYSQSLQDLFSGAPATKSGYDTEFATIRHLNVSPLSDDELDQAGSQSQDLCALLEKARQQSNSSLLTLVRNPFNLRLATTLLGTATSLDEISAIRTQSQLLDRYWNVRVVSTDAGAHGREQLCRMLCKRMAEAGRLQIAASEIPGSESAALHQLKQSGILIEWQSHASVAPDRGLLAFAHNVLFDYACARSLMRALPTAAVDLITENRSVVLTLQPSFVLHFQHLWNLTPDRSSFWEPVLAMQNAAIPSIAQLTGLSVCATAAQSTSDLSNLLGALSSDTPLHRSAASKAVQYLAGAVLSSYEPLELVGENGGPWCEWVRDISRLLSPSTVSAVRVLVYVIGEVSDSLTSEQSRWINEAARNLFDYAWDDETQKRWLLPTVVTVLCRTLVADKESASLRIRRLIDKAEVEKAQLAGLTFLSYEIERLFETAPELAAEFYESIFTADEPPDANVPMGNSQILALTTTVSQELRSIKHQLGEKFSDFLTASTDDAIRTLCIVVEQYANSRARDVRNGPNTFLVGDKHATLIQDYSSSWDARDHSLHDPPLKMLAAFSSFLDALAIQADGRKELESVIDNLLTHNRYAVIWRRLLASAAKHPDAFGAAAVSIAEAEIVMLSSETRVQAAGVLHATFATLDETDRQRIETTALHLPQSDRAWSVEYGERARDAVILGLPFASLTTDAAKQRWNEMEVAGEVPSSQPDFDPHFSDHGDIEEELLNDEMRQGIPAREPQNLQLRQLWTFAKEFTSRFANSIPSDDEIDGIWERLVALRAAIADADSIKVHSAVKNQAIGWLAEVCACIAENDNVLNDKVREAFLKSSLIDASTNDVPLYDPKQEENSSRHISWSSASPRIASADGLMILSRRDDLMDQPTVDAIDKLSRDPVNAVRYMVVRRLRNLIAGRPKLFWKLAEQVSERETSDSIVSDFIDYVLTRLPNDHLDRAVKLMERVYTRFPPQSEDHEGRQSCVYMFLHEYITSNHARCGELLSDFLDDPVLNVAEMGRIVGELREPLGFGLRAVLSSEQAPIRERAWSVAERAAKSVDKAFAETNARFQDLGDDGNADERTAIRNTCAALFNVLDYISADIYFASGSYDDEQASEKGTPNPALLEGRVQYLNSAEPVVRVLSGTGLVPIAHHLMQFLSSYVEVDPKRVFLLIGELIVAAEQQGYQNEPLGANIVVEVVERYLAEYRHILRESKECQELLIRMLDVFVGWPRARKLVYRLGEIYR